MKISMSYITNFKPANFLHFNDLKLFGNKKKNKIISRNFFLFLLLIKYTNKTNNPQLLNTSLFVKPFYKKFITLLRAPYRHKLSRHQFILSRYHVLCTFKINSNILEFSKNFEIFFFIKKFKNFYIWFESNIVYLHQSKIFFNFLFINNFKIINFKKLEPVAEQTVDNIIPIVPTVKKPEPEPVVEQTVDNTDNTTSITPTIF